MNYSSNHTSPSWRKVLITLLTLTIIPFSSLAVDFFWVGGSGSWSQHGTHWATTSGGGVFHNQVPSPNDNVIFDANSFSAGNQILLDVDAFCINMTWNSNLPAVTFHTNNKITTISGDLNINTPVNWVGNGKLIVNGDLNNVQATGNYNFDAADVLVDGDINISHIVWNVSNVYLEGSLDMSDVTWNATWLYLSGSATGNTLSFGGAQINYLHTTGAGEWTLQDELYVRQLTYLQHGSLISNGQRIRFGRRLLALFGDADFNLDLTGTDTVEVEYEWRIQANTSSTIDPGTSVIFFNSNYHHHHYFDGGHYDYYDLYIKWPYNNTSHTFYLRDNGDFHDIKAEFGSQQRIQMHGSGNTYHDVSLEWTYSGTSNYSGIAYIYNQHDFNSLTLKNPAGRVNTTAYIYGNDTINNFNIEGGWKTVQIQSNNTLTVNALNWEGGCTSVPHIRAGSSYAKIAMASGTTNVHDVKLTNIQGVGGATFSGVNCVDGGGNTNWTFSGAGTDTYYWVGGSGNWTDPSHWALSSGGTGNGSCFPQGNNDVIFDANSFSAAGQVVNFNTNGEVRNMTWTSGVTNNPRIQGGYSLTVNEDLVVDATMIYNQTGSMLLHGSLDLNPNINWQHNSNVQFFGRDSNNIIDAHGFIFNHVYFHAKGGMYTLQSDFNNRSGHTFHLYDGTLKSNGHRINFGYRMYAADGNNIYNYHLDLTGTDTVFVERRWEFNTNRNKFKVSAANTVIQMVNNVHDHFYFNGGHNQYGGLDVDLQSTNSSHTFHLHHQDTMNGPVNLKFRGNQRLSQNHGNSIYHDINFISTTTQTTYTPYVDFRAKVIRDYRAESVINTESRLYNHGTIKSVVVPVGHTLSFQSGTTKIVEDSLIAQGSCDRPIIVQGHSSSQAILSMDANATFVMDYVYLKNIKGDGGNGYAATNTADLGNVSGFNAGAYNIQKLYWVGGTGNFSDASHWALSSGGTAQICPPALYDTVIFDANSFPANGGTVTLDVQNMQVGTMIWEAGVQGNPTLAGNQNLTINGDLLIDGQMNYNQNSNLYLRQSFRVNDQVTWNRTSAMYFYSDSTDNTLEFGGLENFRGGMYFNNVNNNNNTSPAWTFLDDMIHDIGYDFYIYRGNLTFNGSKYQYGYRFYAWNGNPMSFDFDNVDSIIVRREFQLYNNVNTTLVTNNLPHITFKSANYEDFWFRGNNKEWGDFDIQMDYPHHGWRYMRFYEYVKLNDVNVVMAQGHNTHRMVEFNSGTDLNDTYGNVYIEAGGAHTYVYSRSGRTWKNISMKSTGHLHSWRWFAENLTADTIRIDGMRMEISNGHTVNAKAFIPANDCTNESEVYGSGQNSVLSVDTNFTVNANYLKLTNHRATGGAVFNAFNANVTGTVTGWNISEAPPYNLYWVGGSGDWDDVNHWSFSSGGAPTGCVIPAKKDNVIFNANSFTPGSSQVTFNQSGEKHCNNFIVNGTTENPRIYGNQILNVWGDMVLNDQMTYEHHNQLRLYGSLTTASNVNWYHPHYTYFKAVDGDHEIDMNGAGLDHHVWFQGGDNTKWTLLSEFTCDNKVSHTIHLERGFLDLNEQDVHFGYQLYSNYGNVRGLDMSNTTVNVEERWDVRNTSNFTLISDNSLILIDDINGSHQSFHGGGLVYDDLTFKNDHGGNYQMRINDGNNTFSNVRFQPAGQKDMDVYGNNTFNSIDLQVVNNNASTTPTLEMHGSNTIGNFTILSPGSAGPYIYLYNDNTIGDFAGAGEGTRLFIGSGKTQDVGNFTLLGTGSAPAFLQSTTAGTQGTLNKDNGEICMDFIWVKDVYAGGTATFNAGASSQDLGNNTNWNFTSCDGHYWVGGTGDWTDVNHWATSSAGTQKHLAPPSKFDNVYFDANSFTAANQVVTIDETNPEVYNMNWLSAFYVPTFEKGVATEMAIYGGLKFSPNMNMNVDVPFNFRGTSGTHLVDAGGNELSEINFVGPPAQSPGGNWILTNDLEVAGQFAIDKGSVSTNGYNVEVEDVLIDGTFPRALSLGNSLVTISEGDWNMADTTEFSFDAGTSELRFVSDAGTNQFIGSDLDYHNVSFETPTTSNISIEGSNSYETLRFSKGIVASVEHGQTQDFKALDAEGTCSDFIEISSSVQDSTTTFLQTSGDVNGLFLILEDVAASGNGTFNANNSIDNGGNTDWVFSSAVVVEANVTYTDPLCPNPNNGTAKVNLNGGTPPFEYEWSTLETSDSIVGLEAGTYFVTVEDSNGCIASDTFNLETPASYGFEAIASGSAICDGASDGTATVQTNGAAGTPTYVWSNGDTDQSIDGLNPGAYTVIVTDTSNCEAEASTVVVEQEPLSPEIAAEGELCGGDTLDFAAKTAGFNGALSFNTSDNDEYITFPESQALNDVALGYTVEAWIKMENTGDWQGIVGKGNSNYELMVHSNGQVYHRYHTVNGGAQELNNTGGGIVPQNTWTHVAITNNGDTARIYVNGALKAERTVTSQLIPDANYPLFIGRSANGGNHWRFKGEMDEVRIWNVARTASELQSTINTTLTGNENGLVAYYPFNDGTGSTTLTSVNPTAPNGTLNNFDVNNDWVASTVPNFTSTGLTYAWSMGDGTSYTSETVAHAYDTSGTYQVTLDIEDASGCSESASHTVVVSEPINVTAQVSDATCAEECDGEVAFNISGGNAPYTVSAGSEFYHGFDGTTIDNNVFEYSNNYSQNDELIYNANGSGWNPYVLTNERFSRESGKVFYAKYFVPTSTHLAMIGWYGQVQHTGSRYQDLVHSFYFNQGSLEIYEDGAYRGAFQNQVPGGYARGIWYEFKIELKSNGALYYIKKESATDYTLVYNSNHSSESNLALGLSSYHTYSGAKTDDWSIGEGSGSGSTTELCAGDYEYTITDANGCSSPINFTVGEPDALSASITHADTACIGEGDVSFSVNTSGGTTPYTYAWNFGDGGTATGANPGHSYNSAGTYNVSVTVTDSNGCELVATSSIVSFQCNQAPTAVCQNATLYVNGNCEVLVSVSDIEGGSTDPDGDNLTYSLLNAGPHGPGTHTVTLVVTDPKGKSDSCDAIVTVEDNTAPTISCPADITVNNDNGECGAIVNYTVSAADNCGATLTYSQNSGTFFPVGTTTVIATATDLAGNASNCSFKITVVDNEPPTITCQNDIITNTDLDSCGAIVGFNAQASDNCSAAVTYSHDPNLPFPTGITIVTATATDPAGNTATCTFAVVTTDTQDPTITCPQDIVVNTDPGDCGAVVTFAATSDDNCSSEITYSHASGSVFPVGTTTVTATAKDPSNNSASCTFTITVNDNEAPVITCPQPIVVNTDLGVCGAAVTFQASATDNCEYEITYDYVSGSVFPVGNTTVTATATDLAGNSSQCSFVITVNDNEAPVVTCPSDKLAASQPGTCGAPVTFAGSSTDNCSSVVTYSHPSGSNFPVGQTAVTVTATDPSGNASSCVFFVTVLDAEAPVITCPANIVVNNDTGVCGANVSFSAQVSDNCSANVVYNPASGSLFPIGTTTVTATATDQAGNNDVCSFTVTVNDTEAPVVNCPSNVSITTDQGVCGAAYSYVATTSDNCSAELSYSHPSGTVFAVGTTTVTVTSTDPAGNQSSCNFDVTVVDDENPVITCPADIVVSNDQGDCSAVVSFAASVTDNCGATLTYSHNSNDTFPVGTTLVSVLAIDVAGNTSNCSFNITVEDNESPNAVAQNVTIYLDSTGHASINGSDLDGGSTDNCGIKSLDCGTSGASAGAAGTNLALGVLAGGLTHIEYKGGVNTNNYRGNSLGTTCNEYWYPNGTFCDEGQDLNNPDYSTKSNQHSGATWRNYSPGSSYGIMVIDLASVSNVSLASVFQMFSDGKTTHISFYGHPNTSGTAPNFSDSSWTVMAPKTEIGPGHLIGTRVSDPTQIQLSSMNTRYIKMHVWNDGRYGSPAWTELRSVKLYGIVGICDYTCADVGDNPATLTVTDVYDNQSTANATVTVIDTISPNAVVQDISVSLDANGQVNITGSQLDNGSNDACGISNLSVSPSSFDCSNLGANSVTVTVTDNNGNSSSAQAVVTVVDDTNPTIVCPADIAVSNDLGDCGAVVNYTATTEDNCSSNISYVPASGSFFPIGTTAVTATATDQSGNSVTCTFNVTVTDDEAPILNCPADIVVSNDPGSCDAVVQFSLNSTDNCGTTTVTSVPQSGSVFQEGTTTVNVSSVDANGNSSTCSFTVTVNDDENPVVITQNIVVQLDSNGMASISPAQIDSASFDNCGIQSLDFCEGGSGNNGQRIVPVNSGTRSGRMITGINYTFNGNNYTLDQSNAIKSSLVLSSLTANPSGDANRFWHAAQTTLSESEALGVLGDMDLATAFQDCADPGGVKHDVMFDTPITPGDGPEVFIVHGYLNYDIQILDENGNSVITIPGSNLGSNVVIGGSHYATGFHGFYLRNNQNYQVQRIGTHGNGQNKVLALDIDPNEISKIGGIRFGGGSCNYTYEILGFQPPANCGANQIDFSCADVGPNTVDLRVTDNSGNSSIGSATVTVEDNIAPVAICQDITIQLDASGNASIVPADIDNGSNDACGIQSLVLDVSSFDCTNVGPNAVVLTVTDNNGNVSTCNSTVTVQDNVAPVAVCQDITIQLDASGNASITPADIDNGSNDACGIQSLALDVDQFDCTNVGPNAVVLTVTDNNGNVSTCNSTVTVQDNVAPVAVCQDITIQLDANGNASITPADIDNGSNDACGIQSLALDEDSFDCTNVGPNAVVLTVTDNNGNVSTCNSTVTVEDNVAPVAVCQDITIQLDASGNASITPADIDNGSNDACGIDSLSLDVDSFDCTNVGPNAVVLTVTDNNGNVSTCNSTVTVQDNVDPVAVCQDITIQLDANGNASITPADIDNGSNDACGIAETSIDVNTFDCTNVGANTVVLTVTDNNGNSSTCTSTVTVQDNVAPVAVCQDITVQLDASGNASITPADIDNGSNDACGIASLVLDVDSFDCSNVGPNTVVLTVTDNNGNVSTCTSTLTVEDNEAPVIDCSNTQLAYTTDPGSCTATVNFNVTATDNCSAVITYSHQNGGQFPIGLTVVTATATDPSGNQDSCTFVIVTTDDEAPVVNCPADITQTNDPGDCGAVVTYQASSSDNCSSTMTYSHPSGSFFPVGTTTVTVTATDPSSNSSSCTFDITVTDDEDPVVLTQNITVQLDANGNASITPGQIDNNSHDNCTIDSLSLDIYDFDCSDVGANTVILTAVDIHGNVSSNSATVTVEDNIDPIAICQDITVQLDASGNASITPADVDNGSNDACNVSLAIDVNSFDCSNVGPNTVVLTVTDDNGNVSTCTSTVTVEDNIDPIAICQDITVQLDASGNASITPADVDNGSNDACNVSLAIDVNSFDCSNVGPNTVTLTVTDDNGNVSTCTSTVTVQDNVAPVALCQDITIQLDASGNVSITPADIDNGSNDACGIASLVLDVDSFDCSNVGPNTVVLTVTDNNGNVSTCTSTVTVEDNEAPVIDCSNTQLAYTTDPGSCTATVNFNVTASDNCSAVITYSHQNGGQFPIGLTVVTATATDPSGNQDSCTFVIVTTDDEAPVVNCPADITQTNDPGDCGAVVTYQASSSDNCSSTMTYSHPSGSFFPVGTTTVTVTATDPSSNSSSCTFDITVTDDEDPVVLTQNITVQLDANGNASITPGQIDNNSHDNCTIDSLSLDIYDFDCSDVGANTVILTAVDIHGNVSSNSATVTVEDNIDPIAICQDIIVQLDASGNASITPADVDNGSNDACNVSLAIDVNSFDCSNVGPNTVVLTVTDDNGNVSTCTSTVTVEDNIDPIAICQDITVQLDASGNASITPADVDNGSNDACNVSLAIDVNSFDCSNVGANTVTLTVTDDNGNVSTCTSTVTVQDNVAPVAVCQDITVQLDASGNASITPADIDNGSNDACGIQSLVIDVDSFNCSNVGPNTVVLTVTDNNGNVSTCTSTVTVQDNVAPIALCQDITIQLDANGNASIVPGDVDNGSNDACGIQSLVLDVDQFDCSNVGANPIVLTVTDNNGNVTTCNSTVTVQDNVAPVAICQDITIQLDGNGNASIVPSDIDNGSNDACGIQSLDLDISSFDCSNLGPNTVVLTVTDNNGNSTTCSSTVTVQDNEAPVITCPENIIVNNDLGICGAVVNFEASSTDNCSSDITYSHVSGDVYPVGTTTVTATATDPYGNSTQCSFDIVVSDNENPIAIAQDVWITLLNASASVIPADIDAGSTDNCGIASVLIDQEGFGCDDIGEHQVVLTVTDIYGNVSTDTAVIHVQGDVPTCYIESVPTNNVFTGGDPNVLYLGYGAQSTTLSTTVMGGSGFTYQWTGSDLDCYTCQNPVFTPSSKGNYTFSVIITNSNGCQTSCTITICVFDARVLDKKGNVKAGKVQVCHIPPGNPGNAHTIEISENAVASHLAHGCSVGDCNKGTCSSLDPKSSTTPTVELDVHDELNIEPTVEVYPNPSSDIFNIDFTSESDELYTIKLYDVTGKMVFFESAEPNATKQINLILAKGVYMIEVQQGEFVETMRLVRE